MNRPSDEHQWDGEAWVVPESNDPPSPLHSWNGETWVLPAEHELTMLDELVADKTVTKAEAAKQRPDVEARLDDQREEIA